MKPNNNISIGIATMCAMFMYGYVCVYWHCRVDYCSIMWLANKNAKQRRQQQQFTRHHRKTNNNRYRKQKPNGFVWNSTKSKMNNSFFVGYTTCSPLVCECICAWARTSLKQHNTNVYSPNCYIAHVSRVCEKKSYKFKKRQQQQRFVIFRCGRSHKAITINSILFRFQVAQFG